MPFSTPFACKLLIVSVHHRKLRIIHVHLRTLMFTSAVQCTPSQSGSTYICHDNWWMRHPEDLPRVTVLCPSPGSLTWEFLAHCRPIPNAACLLDCALSMLKKSCSGWGNGFVWLLFSSKHVKSCSIKTCSYVGPVIHRYHGLLNGLPLLI